MLRPGEGEKLPDPRGGVIKVSHFAELYRLFFKPGFEPTKEEGERLKRKYGYRDKPRAPPPSP